MHALLKRALIAILFAFSASGSGHSGQLQHGFGGESAVVEQMIVGAVAQGVVVQPHEADAHYHHHAPGSEHDHSDACAIGHTHCCPSAILVTGHAIAIVMTPLPRFDRHNAIAHGQPSSPPLRPPRNQA